MDSNTLERQASAWLARRDGDQWTAEDEAAFTAWQQRSTAHRIAVIRVKTIWQHANRLQALGAGMPRGRIPSVGEWRLSPFVDSARSSEPHPTIKAQADGPEPENELLAPIDPAAALRPLPSSRGLGAWAAAVLLAAGAAMAWHAASREPNVYKTAVGDTQAVHLLDGSRVTLNTASKIHVDLSPSERRIELDQGEAFFEVAQDPTRPFVVRAGGKKVVAVGTQFSVFRERDDVRVVVTEGRVRIEDADMRHRAELATQLTAGSVAHVGEAGVIVKQSSVTDAEGYLSWRSGYIALHDTPLADAVAEFNRYNERQIVFRDPELGGVRIGGNLRLDNLDAFLRVLDKGFSIHSESDGHQVVLSKR